MIVKVSLPSTSNEAQADVETQDGTVKMKVASALMARRFADKSQRVGFFHASIDDQSQALEIGERVSDQNW